MYSLLKKINIQGSRHAFSYSFFPLFPFIFGRDHQKKVLIHFFTCQDWILGVSILI